MNKLQITGIALAVGAASMFAIAPAFADDTATTAPMVNCKGGNACNNTLLPIFISHFIHRAY